MTDTDPTTLTSDQLRAALDLLGIGGWDDIARVEIDPQRVTVVRFRLDENGHRFIAGNWAARTTTTIGIDWSDE